jgi:hypothetical protein
VTGGGRDKDGGRDGAGQVSSGLRNPEGAVRGVGAAALAAEGLVLLLAIQPMRVLGANLSGLGVGVIAALAVVCFALAGLVHARGWVWYAGPALQVVLLACGYVFHAAMAALGVIFGLVWIYLLHVRRAILR